MLRVAIVDLGMGNLRSVQRALERAATDGGVELAVTISADPGVVSATDKIVFPGQGAFRDCAAALQGGLGEAIRERIAAGTPYLGICLGLQALFQSSEEAPGAAGLGVFEGAVKLLGPAEGIKIPHMGWNRLSMVRPGAGALATFDADPPYVYFVHSYHAVPADESIVAAVTEHGPHRITAAVQRDNVVATQFHPEKSQGVGLRFLRAFVAG
jgi:glutamine amidotransferase